jgi:hypothetical protein
MQTPGNSFMAQGPVLILSGERLMDLSRSITLLEVSPKISSMVHPETRLAFGISAIEGTDLELRMASALHPMEPGCGSSLWGHRIREMFSKRGGLVTQNSSLCERSAKVLDGA